MKKASIEIDITRECNLQCKNCVRFSNIFNDNPKSRISIYEFKKIFHELKSYFSLTECVIIGGEPTLHPQFKEICLLAKYFMLSSGNSNIYLGTNFTNESLYKWYLNNISKNILFFDIFKELLKKNTNIKEFIVENFHLNLYGVKTIQNLDEKKLKKYCHEFDTNNIPIYIYKLNNELRYAFCWNSVFISRLLQKEDIFTFKSLNLLLKIDTSSFIKNICKYCIVASYIMKNNISDKNFEIYNLADKYVEVLKNKKYIANTINKDFLNGFKYMIEHKEFYKDDIN